MVAPVKTLLIVTLLRAWTPARRGRGSSTPSPMPVERPAAAGIIGQGGDRRSRPAATARPAAGVRPDVAWWGAVTTKRTERMAQPQRYVFVCLNQRPAGHPKG